MNILVCIKPDMAGQDIGPFESLALEAGLILKEKAAEQGDKDWQVDVVTVGPIDWEDCLRRAFGMGADNGFHILVQSENKNCGLIPASETAVLLAQAIQFPGLMPSYDLILTGVMSQDVMAGQTCPMLGELLGVPAVTAVIDIDKSSSSHVDKQIISTRREWEGGIVETMDIPLPAVLSVQSGVYSPRYPTLSHMLKAGEKSIEIIYPEKLKNRDIDPIPREIICEIKTPEKTREALVVSGSLEDQVQAFADFLEKRAL